MKQQQSIDTKLGRKNRRRKRHIRKGARIDVTRRKGLESKPKLRQVDIVRLGSCTQSEAQILRIEFQISR